MSKTQAHSTKKSFSASNKVPDNYWLLAFHRTKIDRSVFSKDDHEKTELLNMRKQVRKELVKKFGTKRPTDKQFTHKLKFTF